MLRRAALPFALLLLLLLASSASAFLALPSTGPGRQHLVTASAEGPSSSGSSNREMPHPRKMDKRWQKKRRLVELGPDGLPVAPVHAPRQMSSNK